MQLHRHQLNCHDLTRQLYVVPMHQNWDFPMGVLGQPDGGVDGLGLRQTLRDQFLV